MTPIQQIKAAIPCGEYIARFIDVRRGKALCPFHKEKTASFQVHDDYFKCHGCQIGGDIIKFATAYHSISTGDAIRMLADELGISLTRQPAQSPYDAKKDERLRVEAEEWRRLIRKSLQAAMIRADQLQPPWHCEYYERSPQIPNMLPDIGCRWTRVDFSMPDDVDDAYDRILPFLEFLDSMTRQQALTAYKEQRTLEQASELRASIRDTDLWQRAFMPLAEKYIVHLSDMSDEDFERWTYTSAVPLP